MSDKDDVRLDLLLFSVGGVYFAADAGQVSGIAAYGGEQGDDLFWFHKELGYGDESTAYLSPTVVTIRTGNEQSYRVIIDSMDDIAEFQQNDIIPFPALLEPFAVRRGLWAILAGSSPIVLLVDFQLLLKQKRIKI